MSSIPLHYIDLRTFCYATEDAKRVEDALRLFLPEDWELTRAESEGHYGDRILVMSARVETADEMRTILGVVSQLDDDDLAQVESELDDRVDDNCSFFLTLDKQAAYNGTVSLGDGITLRAKVEAYPAKKPQAKESMADVLSAMAAGEYASDDDQ